MGEIYLFLSRPSEILKYQVVDVPLKQPILHILKYFCFCFCQFKGSYSNFQIDSPKMNEWESLVAHS